MKSNIIFLFCLTIFFSCKKNIELPSIPDKPSTQIPGNPAAKITEIGKPIGEPTVKVIGTAGGALVSEDGAMVVTIPAGALEQSTEIRIQAITNQVPNGLENAYRILPADLVFKKKISLCWKFNKTKLHGAKPAQLIMARQSEGGTWNGSRNVNVDQRDSTMCFQGVENLKNTDWAVAGTICMKKAYLADYVMLHGQVDYRISAIAISNDAWNPIPAEVLYRDKAIKARTVNGVSSGNELEGYFTRDLFSSSAFSAQYDAPAYQVPNINPVEIKAIVETQPGILEELVTYQTVLRGNNTLNTSLEGSAKSPNGLGTLEKGTLTLFVSDGKANSEIELVGVITVKNFDLSKIKDFESSPDCTFTVEKSLGKGKISRRYDSKYSSESGTRYAPGTLKLSSISLVPGKPQQRLVKATYQAEVRWQSGDGYHISTMSGSFEGLLFLTQ